MKGFFSALGFLTALPAPARPLTPASLAWFPVAGGVVGLILAASLAAASWFSALAAPVVVLAAWVLITRGLHIDGLSDTADALGSAHPRERRLEILKDPHPGVFGVTAIVLVLLTKGYALFLIPEKQIDVLFAAAVFARWQTAISAMMLKPIPVDGGPGLGAAIVGQTKPLQAIAATATAALAVCLLDTRIAALAALVALATGMLVSLAASRSLGGVNGDVLGAGIELSESMILLSALCLLT